MAHQHKGFEADNCPRCGTAQRRMGQMDSVPDSAVPERAKNPHPRTIGKSGEPPTPWEAHEMAEDDREHPRDPVVEQAENARMFRGEVTPPQRGGRPNMRGMRLSDALDAHIAFHGAQHLESEIYNHQTDGVQPVDRHALKVSNLFSQHYAEDNR